MNAPSDSRNAIKTPLSPVIFASRSPSLFVPTKTMPPATTTLPYVCEPSVATHLTFFFALTSQLVGSPFMLETMLRSGVPPHMGQSPDPGSEAEVLGARRYMPWKRIGTISNNRFLTLICSRTPLHCRSRVQPDRFRRFREHPGGSGSGQYVQSSMQPVRLHHPATPCHARAFYRRASFPPVVLTGTTHRVSTRTVWFYCALFPVT